MTRAADKGAAAAGRATTRVRYPETDRMGVAHHTHYFVWFEMGRTELMRSLDCPYGELEDRDGLFFPVVAAGATYRSPARYDDEVGVETTIDAVGGARVRFSYRIIRESDGTLLATGFTEHASVGDGGRPRRLPSDLRRRLLRAARQEGDGAMESET